VAALALASGRRGASETELRAWLGWDAARVRAALSGAESAGTLIAVGDTPRRWLRAELLETALSRLLARLAELHRAQPLAPAHPRPSLRAVTGLDDAAFGALLLLAERRGLVRGERDSVRLATHEGRLSDEE